jgi:hypothetical protein
MRRLIRFLCGVCLLGQVTISAAAPLPEYAVKAAFLYNFALFTDWPPRQGEELKLCILGPDPFGPALDELAGKPVHGMRISIVRMARLDRIKSCDMLYFGESERGNFRSIQREIGELPVLTVTDAEDLVEAGVMIGMQVEKSRIAFDVNLGASQRAKLVFNSKLLRLARKVYGE